MKTIAEREIEWTASNGAAVVVAVSLVRNVETFGGADIGEAGQIDRGLEIRLEARAAGKLMGTWMTTDHMPAAAAKCGCVAMIGNLGIKADNFGRIENAKSELAALPEYVAQVERRAAKAAEMAEYERKRNAITKAMGV